MVNPELADQLARILEALAAQHAIRLALASAETQAAILIARVR